MLKRGNIPVTIFVVAVIALFIFALLVLMLYNARGKDDVVRGYSAVRELNIEVKNFGFSGIGDSVPIITKTSSGFFGFGEEVVEIKVRRVPTSVG
ncbi:hypothetical protein AUJ84_00910 [Candidatus Pacearchaeota archaeon CG1_02_32_132]|nr:MAG: hypothetical protein AUJ84_00910 [Candidatus Pacearchaeota archaeon CG1_02_32_132]